MRSVNERRESLSGVPLDVFLFFALLSHRSSYETETIAMKTFSVVSPWPLFAPKHTNAFCSLLRPLCAPLRAKIECAAQRWRRNR